jgi:hypothetical protein
VPGEVDFRETVDELKEAGGDVILFLGLEHEGATFIKAARGMGLKTPIVGAFSDTPEMHAIAGPLLEGVMFYEIYDVNSPRRRTATSWPGTAIGSARSGGLRRTRVRRIADSGEGGPKPPVPPTLSTWRTRSATWIAGRAPTVLQIRFSRVNWRTRTST